jgi:5-methylcytosine-specific restriction endonuclease McrA
MSRTSAGRPCSHIDRNGRSCPNLQPCEAHPARDRNAPWSEGRSSTDQGRFRRAVLALDGFTCRRCGHHDPSGRSLQAHHVSPERGVTLCRDCHRAVDGNAR